MKPDPPPPSARLLDAVNTMQPARARSPWRSLSLLLVVLAVYASLPLLFIFRTRPDLPDLPLAWFLGVGFAWLLGLVLPLMAALLPRPRQVLPDGVRAFAVAAGAIVALLVVSLLFPAPDTAHASHIGGLFGHCLHLSLALAVVPLAASLMMLRRLAPVGSWRFGAAVGAAGGALSGTLLHMLCSVTSRWHVAAAHCGAVLLCAAFGALVASRVLD
jgi:hypothetical protein